MTLGTAPSAEQIEASLAALTHEIRETLASSSDEARRLLFAMLTRETTIARFGVIEFTVLLEDIQPTNMERAVLDLLMQHPLQILSFDDFTDALWPDLKNMDQSNTLLVHISRLRRKIEKSPMKDTFGSIETVRGEGYMWRPGER